MAAIVEFSEANGVGETVTDDIANINFGDSDSAELVPGTYPVICGANSYEKYIKVKFSDSFTEISNMKLWQSDGDLVTGEVIKADEVTAYATPVKTTSTEAITAVPTEVGSAIEVHSAAGADTISAPGYTRYVCLQTQTTGSTPAGAGNQKTFTFQYDEM
jgi:hypothetical protein